MSTLEIDTPHGPARAHLLPVASPRALLALGHGAGGGVAARDLVTTADVAQELGVAVALVEQPYRVAGRRSVAPTRQLDAAWLAVLTRLRDAVPAGTPMLAGGRSSGARVACRTATEAGVAGVLCLAFPLHPPQRDPAAERKTRLPELEAVTVPVLVVQGVRDRFGLPPAAPGRTVVAVQGDHALKSDLPAVADAVRAWLPVVLG